VIKEVEYTGKQMRDQCRGGRILVTAFFSGGDFLLLRLNSLQRCSVIVPGMTPAALPVWRILYSVFYERNRLRDILIRYFPGRGRARQSHKNNQPASVLLPLQKPFAR